MKEKAEHQDDEHCHEQGGERPAQTFRQRSERVYRIGIAVNGEHTIERHQQIADVHACGRNPLFAADHADERKAGDHGRAVQQHQLNIENKPDSLLGQRPADMRSGHSAVYGSDVRH